jgi:mono/diheme cytochrome c family protein
LALPAVDFHPGETGGPAYHGGRVRRRRGEKRIAPEEIRRARMVESIQRHRRTRGTQFVFALAVVSVLLLPSRAPSADAEPAKLGKSLYRVYCASCHGDSAKGDGSTAAYLTVKPTDLTKLSRQNGGKFPAERLHEVIDGREVVRAHGEREMPLWGFTFQDWNADAGQEDAVRQKIDQLLSYLETIQKK